MKLVKSLLLGSVAGLAAVAGAQAADLPVKKAAAVEYVRVCSTYGAGFFYIPGTETCLRVGGRVRAEYRYVEPEFRTDDSIGFRTRGRIQLDARTATAYGLLRTFVRFEMTRDTGVYGNAPTSPDV
ncbi:MAG: porin, partial [Microvirga sp.]